MAKKKVHASRKAAGKSVKKKHLKPAAKTRKTSRSAAGSAPDAARAAIDTLAWVHATTDKLIDHIPAADALHQPCGTDNHLLWTVGHLAVTYCWFASLLDGRPVDIPAGYNERFGYGSKPVADAAAYPSLAEVRKHYAAAYQRMMDAVSRLKPSDFGKPTVADSHGFARTRLDVVLRAAWHDGWHSGQLSAIRRSLGLPSIM
jgi:hypothetical protein